ncbi:type II toxin-antitoxin system VapB family antitoxin [Ornithinimicrobium sp. INDO-MA30-4]|uniref:type II toxin-antitoxin system VapB family antitoxin n=1 Tax=Ornithinimicrobium sp. INDO-MA30-4 TaxID=2908651 RepID=UPI001F23BBE5|nr:type II toxin-antitoxin system VapB family antitoxin [Ornithinimicrobium sp. INDO-MA30-4]UJH71168.1 type II toxin-antitoxin system VapB family antitoxin [Ornithinimicrobium sp. INDO-MA30-4]
MSLNIKNPRTHELVRELARRTGQSQTSAVEDAVARRLAELGSADVEAPWAHQRRAAMEKVVRACDAGLTDEDRERIRAAQEDMYDDLGLPK